MCVYTSATNRTHLVLPPDDYGYHEWTALQAANGSYFARLQLDVAHKCVTIFVSEDAGSTFINKGNIYSWS